MKKLLLALLCALIVSYSYGQATLIPPMHPDLVQPASTSFDVYIPKKTSAYSYERVRFDTVAGTGTGYRPQNLYVYSWNGENYVNSGIAWCRRDTNNVIKDTGYIAVPTWKTYMSVGILQNSDSSKTYVIASYYGGTIDTPRGARYDLYEWTPSGISTPSSVGFLFPSDTGVDLRWGFNRIKMDTWNLKRAVFVWDEAESLDSLGGSIVDTGGIYIKVLQNTGAEPFTTSDSLHIKGTDFWGVKPDVAFADSGNLVRIAYYNSDTTYTSGKPLYVRNRPFNTVMSSFWPTVDFNWDDSVSNTIFLTSASANDHINIDCPDNYPYDIWSVVYNYDDVTLFARTHPVSGPNVTQMLNLYLTQPNRYPAICYSRDATQINYGWFTGGTSSGPSAYVGTRLFSYGTGFVPPTTAGTYFNIASYPGATPGAGGTRLSFSRQNDHNAYLFMAYPLPGVLGPGSLYLDMRSKQIEWFSTSMRPTGIEDLSNANAVNAYPNPFTGGFTLQISDYNRDHLSVALADISGKVIGMYSGDLDHVNAALQQVGARMSKGIYYLNIASESQKYNKVIKLTKQ